MEIHDGREGSLFFYYFLSPSSVFVQCPRKSQTILGTFKVLESRSLILPAGYLTVANLVRLGISVRC